MNSKILLVAGREYLKVIRKPSFWIATLFFPIFFIIISLISGYSAQKFENKLKNDAKNAKAIFVLDESGIIPASQVQAPFKLTTNFDEALGLVKTEQADALLFYPKDLASAGKIMVFAQDKGIFLSTRFNEIAQNLVKQSILQGLGDQTKIKAFNTAYQVDVKSYKKGEEVKIGPETFIVPAISVILYFTLTTFATSFLLMSVSEEKENRMIETVLSLLQPKQLIAGKILGQISIVLTQLGTLLLFIAVGFAVVKLKLPFNLNLSEIHITFRQVFFGLFYTICGFLILSNVMVGVGSAMPTYKEAQSFSSIFIIISIFPVYFTSLLLAEPSGTIARVLSYFPLSSSIILIFRNSLGELSRLELVASSVTMVLYVILSFILAYKLFEIGSLEYNNKISVKRLLGRK